ncbi:hypothetical protein CNYM01_02242 [Colletotrichum nymphaeae SA-01]|uniref:2EXR domain-containing protein n=1 Tax=Colletotrichum nymphaeae SA-01 TaxID=1460502 RepID=A0A135T9E9_9PEZI|nr:hypothetical protein CNYM01_02242 [Colletotrichum nymphaeae SA-01]
MAVDTQETLASIMSLQTKIMKEQAAMVLSRQQAAAMPSKQQEQEPLSVRAAAFPEFGRLPAELRRLIWKMALPGRRVLEQADGVVAYPELCKKFRPPVIRAVCKEAWEVTEQNGLFVYGPELTASGGTWFNPKQDVIIIRNPGEDYPLGPLEDCRPEIIAVDRRYFEQDLNFERVLDVALQLKSCRRLIILLRTTPNLPYKKGAAPKLFSLQAEDVIWSFYADADEKPNDLFGEDDVSWKKFKDTIQANWDDQMRDSGRMDDIMKYGGLPVIEGMELIMCKEDEISRGF